MSLKNLTDPKSYFQSTYFEDYLTNIRELKLRAI